MVIITYLCSSFGIFDLVLISILAIQVDSKDCDMSTP